MRIRLFILAALLLAFVSGCGEKKIPVYPVKGTVKFKDGKPLPGGFVEFVCQDGEAKGRNSNSKIEKDGSFELESFGQGKGAYAGTNLVTVHPLGVEFDAEKGKEVRPEVSVPEKYKDYATSGLKFTIEAKENKIDIVIDRK